jgi:hypothetical protein
MLTVAAARADVRDAGEGAGHFAFDPPSSVSDRDSACARVSANASNPTGRLVERPRPGARFFPIEPQRENTGSP